MFNKNVYFIGSGYMGCWYVRCFLPMVYNGWLGTYKGLTRELKSERQVMNEIIPADIVVFHRARTPEHHKLGIMLRKMGKKIVYDNDDTYKIDKNHPFYSLDEKGFEENKKYLNNITDNFIINSDLVTCSTEFLAKEYRKLNENVIVLPNCVNPDDWDEPLRNDGDKIRIGIVGSTAYNQDFEEIKDIIRILSDDDRVQLVMFGLFDNKNRTDLIKKTYKREIKFWDTIRNVEWVKWVEMVNYFDVLNELRLDLMLIPRKENNFNKAKSNVKFLEASMLEIPVIAQGFSDGLSPYDNDLDGTNGILIKRKEDWLPSIYKLINDKKIRRIMGKTAKNYVLKNYNIKNHHKEWLKAYKTMYEKN